MNDPSIDNRKGYSFDFEGIQYLRDDEDNIYTSDKAYIGKWDNNDKLIRFRVGTDPNTDTDMYGYKIIENGILYLRDDNDNIYEFLIRITRPNSSYKPKLIGKWVYEDNTNKDVGNINFIPMINAHIFGKGIVVKNAGGVPFVESSSGFSSEKKQDTMILVLGKIVDKFTSLTDTMVNLKNKIDTLNSQDENDASQATQTKTETSLGGKGKSKSRKRGKTNYKKTKKRIAKNVKR